MVKIPLFTGFLQNARANKSLEGDKMTNIEQEIEKGIETYSSQAKTLVVSSPDEYAGAGELGKGIKELRAKVVEYFKPLKESAYAAHKAVTAKEAGELKPIDEALNQVRQAMNSYTEAVKRIEAEAQRKANEAAEKEAAKERERLLAQAVKADTKGNTEKAEELIQKAQDVYVAPVTVAPIMAKTVSTASGNITQTKTLEVEVIDLFDFVKELVEKGRYPTMLEVKTAALKAWVNANGLDVFPGLRITRGTSARF